MLPGGAVRIDAHLGAAPRSRHLLRPDRRAGGRRRRAGGVTGAHDGQFPSTPPITAWPAQRKTSSSRPWWSRMRARKTHPAPRRGIRGPA